MGKQWKCLCRKIGYHLLVWTYPGDTLWLGRQYFADSAAQINTGNRSMPTDAIRTTSGRMARALVLITSMEAVWRANVRTTAMPTNFRRCLTLRFGVAIMRASISSSPAWNGRLCSDAAANCAPEWITIKLPAVVILMLGGATPLAAAASKVV